MHRSPPEESLRKVLIGEHAGLHRFRTALGRIPASPRCNPAICNNCIKSYSKPGMDGAEIPVSMLFADIRGSTGIGERLSPTEFHDFLSHFYRVGSRTILRHDGLVDNVVGDEIIGLFFGGVSGPRHAAAAIDAAVDLVASVAREGATPSGAIPLGAGVHTGEAYVGPTGPEGEVTDFTALGDAVNTTARLASSAAAGELLVSIETMTAAGRPTGDLERRELEVRGREATIDVVVLRPTV